MNHSALKYRRTEFAAASTEVFDVVIIGGGITGACLFHQLRQKGYRVLLADKSDFAGGTSQASAMMLWGGLAYLRSFDLPTVFRLCSSRDALVHGMKESVQPRNFRYIVPTPSPGNRITVQSALYLYWLLGGFRRSRPGFADDFAEQAILKPQRRNCFQYQEAHLPESDARFVLQWILRARDSGNPALNYCGIRGGSLDSANRQWVLDAEDLILDRQFSVRAKIVVNAAGVWTDRINEQFGIDTPYKHILSKGVFVGLRRRASHETSLIVQKEDRDCYALIPWGPVSLWGPTETITHDVQEGFSVTAEDIDDLTREYNRHFAARLETRDIVSFRCGVRGLAVPRTVTQTGRTQDLSRKYVVHHDRDKPWISIHGGKLTSCVSTANAALQQIERSVLPTAAPLPSALSQPPAAMDSFPGLKEMIPSAQVCAEESCWSLTDYLRRRTNVAQWVPRGGLGTSGENTAHLERLASVFSTNSACDPRLAVARYRQDIETSFDRILPVEAL